MKTLLAIILGVSLGAWSLGSMAQEGAGSKVQRLSDSGLDGERPSSRLDGIYPEDMRVVIGDREYFLEGPVAINGQEVSARGAIAVLREGQRLSNIVAEREGGTGRLILKGVDTF